MFSTPALYVLAAFLLPFMVGLPRFQFPQMDNESYPSWIADDLDRRTLVQGGIVLDESQFSTNANGYKYVESGTLVGRTDTEAQNGDGFAKVSDNARDIGTADATNDQFVIPGEDLVQDFLEEYNQVFEVKGSTGNDGLYEVDSVAYDGADTTVSVRGNVSDGTDDGQIHIVTDDEIYLTAHDLQYAGEEAQVAAVRRGTLIRPDQLPGYSSMSEPVKRFLRSHFEAVPATV